MTYIIISLIIGYLLGCIHPSYFISKWKKINIKEHGSKNAGASNITVVLGWKYGIIVALIDIIKPVLSILLIWLLFQHSVEANDLQFLYYVSGGAVIVGHIFPFFMKFNGGKGTASLIGLFLVINWKIALITLILFVVLTIVTNYIVIGALALNASFLIFTWYPQFDIAKVSIAGLLVLIFLLKHKENFIRIVKGTETGLRSTMKKKNSDYNSKGTTI
ncbi:glycerol-3-phosphate acyltransferase [Salirhabdus sp. Marseille-P4669]|uniref:glycerol-3-phosphate acyltransferase n=1 Tax=Salirhabdus sp. Marseille-P4669 TaxID=2042310 RepID=UPI000C79E816|nr:glycerol-3-phosphate acyltransferase [Salirhabdus sp. Marseille-P4669]